MSIQMEALAEAIRDRMEDGFRAIPLTRVRYINNGGGYDHGGKIDIDSATLHLYGSEIWIVGDVVGGIKFIGLISDPDLVERVVALWS